jgi:hypothetical protein
MTTWIELNEAQRRQQLDAESVFDAHESTEEEAWRHRGFMFWREVKGRNYLVRSMPDARQQGLGADSEATRKTYETFTARKSVVEARLKDLREQMVTMQRLNRALRVGRTPDILIDVLNTLAKARLAEHFLLVGTNALYAYETAAGVRLPNDVLATRDADFLYDTRSRAAFVQIMDQRGGSFLDLLRKADKTFERHPSDNHTAVNSRGYEIDLLRRFPPPDKESSEHPMRMTPHEDDLWAVRAPTGNKLLAARLFSQVVVGTSGQMARMRTVHPLAFARIKRQLAQDPEREALKAPKDAAQAELVEELVATDQPPWRAE